MKNLERSTQKIAQSVAGLTTVTASLTPASGKNVKIEVFTGASPMSANQTTRLLWNAAIVWQFTGPEEMPFQYDIAGADVDGVKTVDIQSINAAVTAVNMSAFVQIVEFDDD